MTARMMARMTARGVSWGTDSARIVVSMLWNRLTGANRHAWPACRQVDATAGRPPATPEANLAQIAALVACLRAGARGCYHRGRFPAVWRDRHARIPGCRDVFPCCLAGTGRIPRIRRPRPGHAGARVRSAGFAGWQDPRLCRARDGSGEQQGRQRPVDPEPGPPRGGAGAPDAGGGKLGEPALWR